MLKIKSKNRYILDASAIINTNVIDLDNEYFTVPEVIQEIRDFKSRALLLTLMNKNKIKILDPSKKSINKIKKVASRLKCYSKLSDTDIKVLALAYELFPSCILSDDKYIHKVAQKLGIPFTEICHFKLF